MHADHSLSGFILTADVGGSHITAGLYNANTGNIVGESITRVGVASKGSSDNILSSWSGALQSVLNRAGVAVAGLSIAMPGPFDYEKGISFIKGLNKYESIYGMDIKEYLSGSLNIDAAAIRFRNDAESTIAGEVLAGAGKNYRVVMGVTLGTGFGSAYSQNKVTGDLNLGSESYRESIADDYFSTRWFLRRYNELTGKQLADGVKELTVLANNDAVAAGVFTEFADNMAEFLSKPIRLLHPEVLILCGNIARASELFLPRLSQKLNSINIQLARLGENAPLIGAAAIFEKNKV